MCETECESGWKHSYGVCGGCIIKHNEAIQKTRLVVIAEVNAASIGSPQAAEPGGKNRGKGMSRAPSACCCAVTPGLAAREAAGGRGTSQHMSLGSSKISTGANTCLVSRYSCFQPAVWTPCPVSAFILTTLLGGGEVLSLAPAERERRSLSLRAQRQLEPVQWMQLQESRQPWHTHAGRVPMRAPNLQFF